MCAAWPELAKPHSSDNAICGFNFSPRESSGSPEDSNEKSNVRLMRVSGDLK